MGVCQPLKPQEGEMLSCSLYYPELIYQVMDIVPMWPASKPKAGPVPWAFILVLSSVYWSLSEYEAPVMPSLPTSSHTPHSTLSRTFCPQAAMCWRIVKSLPVSRNVKSFIYWAEAHLSLLYIQTILLSKLLCSADPLCV